MDEYLFHRARQSEGKNDAEFILNIDFGCMSQILRTWRFVEASGLGYIDFGGRSDTQKPTKQNTEHMFLQSTTEFMYGRNS